MMTNKCVLLFILVCEWCRRLNNSFISMISGLRVRAISVDLSGCHNQNLKYHWAIDRFSRHSWSNFLVLQYGITWLHWLHLSLKHSNRRLSLSLSSWWICGRRVHKCYEDVVSQPHRGHVNFYSCRNQNLYQLHGKRSLLIWNWLKFTNPMGKIKGQIRDRPMEFLRKIKGHHVTSFTMSLIRNT